MVHTIQVSDGETMVKLLRDQVRRYTHTQSYLLIINDRHAASFFFQVIIQVGEELDGAVTVRTGASEKPVPCPVQYVQEV